jgi:hypothetical protein
MPDYSPRYKPGESVPSTASATIVGGNVVAVSGTGTVGPAGANALNWVGVAAFDALTGARVMYNTGGVQKLVASGTVTAGDLVVCAAAGQVSTLAAVTTPTPADVTNTRAIVGVALTTATNGNIVDVQMEK